MKNVFAIATIAIVSLSAVMTSCSNGEADDVMAPRPQQNQATSSESSSTSSASDESSKAMPEFDGTIYFYTMPEQSQYMNTIYTVEAGGQTFTVNVDELPVLSTQPEAAQFIKDASLGTTDLSKYDCHSYTLPASVKGSVVTVCETFSVKEGVTMPEKVSFVRGCLMGINSSVHVSEGMRSDKLEGFMAYVAKKTDNKALYK